ncbi:MAG: hypothetical protein QOG52_2010, partial [Frankiaceae bacterium]|nr:hypothetical protein [Frankiaceae bacterium]
MSSQSCPCQPLPRAAVERTLPTLQESAVIGAAALVLESRVRHHGRNGSRVDAVGDTTSRNDTTRVMGHLACGPVSDSGATAI